MSDHQDSITNSSIFSVAEQQHLKKQITLNSAELIQLTYNEDKFNTKLDGFNNLAIALIEEQKYQQAGVYLDQAEKVLQYAAGCGKTIERTLITTILNNQACMLQRNSQFQQSANYLQAIIFNITQFIEGCNQFEPNTAIASPNSPQFTQMATYFQRKSALALYQLRFCALSSHVKKNETALKSARKALNLLKSLCGQQYQYQSFTQKIKPSYQQCQSKSQQYIKSKTILKQLSSIKPIQSQQLNKSDQYIKKAIYEISKYTKRTVNSQKSVSLFAQFQNYSIGNLMQAAPTEINTKPNYGQFVAKETSDKGKIYKIIHIAMAHFTVATQLRLISANKYALDQEQRLNSQEFRESKVYHLLALILISRYLPSKSVFFTHAISSFKNHYGIDLIQKSEAVESNEEGNSFSIANYSQEEVGEFSRIEEGHTYEEQVNKSIQIHQTQNIKGNQLAFNMLNSQYNAALGSTGSGSNFNNASPHIRQNFMKEISNNHKVQPKKIRLLKSKSKSGLQGATSFSRLVEGAKSQRGPVSKNKENKSKSKTLLQSKGRQTIKSRRKQLRTEPDDQNKRTIYYGYPDKSRSKSKKNIIERKNSKKTLGVKGSVAFQNKKIKNQVKVDQQYGPTPKHKHKNLKTSHGFEQQQMTKSHTKQGDIRMKKVKSPGRGKTSQ